MNAFELAKQLEDAARNVRVAAKALVENQGVHNHTELLGLCVDCDTWEAVRDRMLALNEPRGDN